MNAVFRRIPRAVVEGVVVALLVGGLVLLATKLRGEEYESRVSLLATPAAQTGAATAQYGEVVALSLPAVIQLVRSPSVLQAAAAESGTTPEQLAKNLAVELVPASGLARLSVRAPSAAQADAAATAIARAVIATDLLAPVGKLRLLDERPESTRVAPDWSLALGLALAAAAFAGVTAGSLRHLHRARTAEESVRAALAAAGVHHPVSLAREDDPVLAERLAALCAAAARPARVVPVVPELAEQAEALAQRLPDKSAEPADGTAVIAMVHGDRERQDELATALAVLPASAVLVAVVLA